MKINFTKKEYHLLLDMIYLSDWMMHSREIGDEENEYKRLRKKLLSYYKEMDAEDRIAYEKTDGEYHEDHDYEMELHGQFVDAYDEASFWDNLVDKLAQRDVINQIGLEAYTALDGMERLSKLHKAEEKYAAEFEENGLDNLKLSYEKLKVLRNKN